MLRSLFAGISGLRSNQTMLDVVGNNIVFQDTLSQMLTGAGAPVAAGAGNPQARGGTNPIQVGLGVSVGGTTTNFNQGSAQTTGRTTDLMIQGDGFFVVKRGAENLYTRAGAFNFDASGNLVTLDGDLVQGYDANGAGPGNVTVNFTGVDSYSIGSDGLITGIIGGVKTNLGQIALANFANPEGLERAGDTAFRESANSGAPAVAAPGTPGLGSLMGGALEMSNVDLAQEFTNLIIAQRGFQATSRVITTSDSVLEELVNIKR